ncbi:hypothetical protein L484_025360 [Morus notabilis]|uniref:Uncharacterized protein n=1 Tax=Morus notabilis TaxID=981085 RepID=W9R259_9ROSA|nr:hypothetical protein L484_025360 [Morus notabilis]
MTDQYMSRFARDDIKKHVVIGCLGKMLGNVEKSWGVTPITHVVMGHTNGAHVGYLVLLGNVKA